MAPTQIQIATSSLLRLVKEEASYYKEIKQQEASIAKLEEKVNQGSDEENLDYQLQQERKGLQETKNVIPLLRERVTSATEKLESLLETAASEEESDKAVEVLKMAKEAQKNDPVAGQETVV